MVNRMENNMDHETVPESYRELCASGFPKTGGVAFWWVFIIRAAFWRI